MQPHGISQAKKNLESCMMVHITALVVRTMAKYYQKCEKLPGPLTHWL